MKYYAGIGSRSTPVNVLMVMNAISAKLYYRGFTLRSGGADGADKAFQEFADDKADIYLPWPGFNGATKGYVVGDHPFLRAIAAQFHPNWDACNEAAQKLHTRNVAQLMGADQSPLLSEFVVCWTHDGKDVGGTAQALRIARFHKIPIYNLAIDGELNRLTAERLS